MRLFFPQDSGKLALCKTLSLEELGGFRAGWKGVSTRRHCRRRRRRASECVRGASRSLRKPWPKIRGLGPSVTECAPREDGSGEGGRTERNPYRIGKREAKVRGENGKERGKETS